jgi:energy-coupling factor transporter ATP-binding protein EcfA2
LNISLERGQKVAIKGVNGLGKSTLLKTLLGIQKPFGGKVKQDDYLFPGYFEQEGVRYHHIVDPTTGKQARDVMQTTVLTDSATDADILSTTLFVLGSKKGMSFVQELPTTGAIFVGADRQLSYTDNLMDQMEFTGAGSYKTAKD